MSRFKKYLKCITEATNIDIHLRISAEGTHDDLEFNRYGVVWSEFNEKIKYLEKTGVKFTFRSTLSNLSIFGFANFHKVYNRHKIITTFAYTPRMFPIYVMDEQSKEQLLFELRPVLPESEYITIKETIRPTATEDQRINIAEFLTQFIDRRPNLSLDIFPSSFLKWIDI